MKRNLSLIIGLLAVLFVQAQTIQTPDVLWGQLFEEVQIKRIFKDNKTFVDAVPRFSRDVILKNYEQQKLSDSFNLASFVERNFIVPSVPVVKVKEGLDIKAHIEDLWDVLQRKADVKQSNSSLLPLPESYIVPGGRFREIYYWDSYFTMLGLIESKRYALVENMLDNFKFLIEEYGHIPNGNRSYYLSRSQPPFFALMVDLLAEKKGNSIYKKYFSALEKEYKWWMQGEEDLEEGEAHRRVVKMKDGSILNRYWDDKKAPREESFAEDVTTFGETKDSVIFTNLRAGAESGWDFSSRWFSDTMHLKTIETTDIIPVDLNSLLFAYESILSKAARVNDKGNSSVYYKNRADKRKLALQRYCWNDKLKFFFDYNFKKDQTTDKWAASGAMPLFVKLASENQARFAQRNIKEKLLKPGGIATTVYHTGQQWDAPNGWAPLQYITVKGLMNYKFNTLAQTIAERWMGVNEKVFATTGKMLEKYNVEDTNLESGGGEYPTQDGFGWSNGVYLKLRALFIQHQNTAKPMKAF
ncbi:MAG TPA: alpha,alpha-trehalase TreA [Flavisolibacter sp.]|nr:alpha,alpha-trehalase TreA [Flavisolibacter sp.]